MSIPRHVWREHWLICLRELGDIDLQRRKWLDADNRNPHWSYVEFMSCYFDDTLSGGDYASAIRSGLVSSSEADALATFHSLLKSYRPPHGDEYDHDAILGDPSWVETAKTGREALGRLISLLEDPAERRVLIG